MGVLVSTVERGPDSLGFPRPLQLRRFPGNFIYRLAFR